MVTEKKRLSSLIAAYTILFLDNVGYSVVFPIFPLLFLNHEQSFLPVHTPETTRHLLLGILVAAFPLGQFFGAPFFGDLGDRFGRKRALYFTMIGTVIGYLFSASAIFFSLFTLLFFSRLLTGFFSGNLSLAMAAIADLNIEEKARGKSMSLVAALLGISWILSIIMGVFFSNPANSYAFYPALPLLITALLTLLSLWILKQFYFETSPYAREHPAHILKGLHNIINIFESRRLRTFYLILFFWVFGTILALQWAAPVSIVKFSATQTHIMWLFLASGIGWALGSGLVNRLLVQKLSIRRLYLSVLAFISLLFFFTAAVEFFPYFVILYAFSAIPTAIAWSDSFSLISLAAPATSQGKALGIAQSTISFGEFLAPLFGGVIGCISVYPIFYLCSLFVLISFLILLLSEKTVA